MTTNLHYHHLRGPMEIWSGQGKVAIRNESEGITVAYNERTKMWDGTHNNQRQIRPSERTPMFSAAMRDDVIEQVEAYLSR